MGFTFSHPALILPARFLPRKMYSMNGLIIGSMVPDFEYFIRMDNASSSSHTPLGLFFFDLPAALIILTLFHQFMRGSLIKNLPDFFKLRLQTYAHFDWLDYLKKNWLIVVYSVIVGALTHFFWDSFTSGNGYFVTRNPILEKEISIFQMPFFTYKIIKHLSSLMGILILIILFIRLPKQQSGDSKPDKYYWLFHTLLALVIFLFQIALYSHATSLNGLIKKLVSSGLFSILLISIGYKINTKTVTS
ncbi:MAG TPA: DUF4184 family protein [Bacteroidia bacterium]|jgi:hypothetical protein|nr:DUF4184 family protein [Bacteroidia bacterium]